MKIETRDEQYGLISYEESFWIGKRTITIDGTELVKGSKKNTYVFKKEDIEKIVTIKGNFLSGSKLIIEDEEIQLVPKVLWYEWLLSFIPIALVLTWGNSIKAVKIFPIIGGAIGGAIAGLGLAISILFMKQTKNPFKKVLIGIVSCIITILVLYLVAKLYINIKTK